MIQTQFLLYLKHMILSLRTFFFLQSCQFLFHRWTIVWIQISFENAILNIDFVSVHYCQLYSSHPYHHVPVHVLVVLTRNYVVFEELIPFGPPILPKIWLLYVLLWRWKVCPTERLNIWISLIVEFIVESRNNNWFYHVVVF